MPLEVVQLSRWHNAAFLQSIQPILHIKSNFFKDFGHFLSFNFIFCLIWRTLKRIVLKVLDTSVEDRSEAFLLYRGKVWPFDVVAVTKTLKSFAPQLQKIIKMLVRIISHHLVPFGRVKMKLLKPLIKIVIWVILLQITIVDKVRQPLVSCLIILNNINSLLLQERLWWTRKGQFWA